MSRATEERETATPWQIRPFRLLLAADTSNGVGAAVAPVAMAFAVLSLGGSATELGLVVGSYAAAQVLTTLLGGVLGDRLPRPVLMQGSAVASCITQAVVATSLIRGWSSLPLLGVASVLTGCFGALASPSSRALTPQLVPPDLLQRAITWRRLTGNSAMLVGFGVAGMIVAAFGPGWAVAVDAATFLLSALLYQLIRVPPATLADTSTPDTTAPDTTTPDTTTDDTPTDDTPTDDTRTDDTRTDDTRTDPGSPARSHAVPTPRLSVLSDLRAGAQEVMRHTWLVVLVGMAFVYHLVYGGAQGVLGPIVVRSGFGEAAWGWALAALMAGLLAGGALTLRWRPRHALGVGTGLLALTGAFPAAMAANRNLGLILLGAFLHGVGLEFFSVAWDLSIQQNVPADTLARVYAFDIVGSFLARPIGLVLTGWVADAVGLSRWLWVVAALVTGAALACLAVPSVRALERRDTDVLTAGGGGAQKATA